MESLSGLKRSMPCNDLIAMETTVKENLMADRFLDDINSFHGIYGHNKRQRVGLEKRENPATEALERALALEEISMNTFEFDLATIISCHERSFCQKDYMHIQYKHLKSICPPVHSMSDVTSGIARMTTTSV